MGHRAGLLLVAVLAVGCYRTNVRVEPDAGPPPPDAWRAPSPDAWAPDAFVAPSECARDRDCAGGGRGPLCVHDLSLAPRDRAPVPLHCAGPVGTIAPGAECETNADCDHGLCVLAGGCVAPCADDSDCAPSERCASVPVVTSASAMQLGRGCARWVDPPASVTVVSSTSRRVSRFSTERLELPALVAPTRLVLEIADEVDEQQRFVSLLTTSSGEVVFDALALGMRRQDLIVAPFNDFVPVLVPNGDRDFAPGTAFVAQLETGMTSSLREIVLDRAAPGTSLDLGVIYVGVEPPRGGTPPRAVTQMLAQLDTYFGALGIHVGRTRHFVMTGATARMFEVIDDDTEVAELFTYSVGAARPALSVFLVRTGSDFLGISGGAPGAMTAHGTHGSGIAIGFEDLQSILPMFPADEPGTVIAHEIGHFTGLFHTSEIDGTVIDPLADTPECPISNDRDGDGMLFPDECAGAGAENLMFWGPFQEAPVLSPRQRRILQNAMVLQ